MKIETLQAKYVLLKIFSLKYFLYFLAITYLLRNRRQHNTDDVPDLLGWNNYRKFSGK